MGTLFVVCLGSSPYRTFYGLIRTSPVSSSGFGSSQSLSVGSTHTGHGPDGEHVDWDRE